MEEKIKMVQAVCSGFKVAYIEMPFEHAVIESFDLVVLRVNFEKKYKKAIPASEWLNYTCMKQIFDFYTNIQAE